MNKTHWNETIFNENIMQWKNFLFIGNRFPVIPGRILIQIYKIAHREGKISSDCQKLLLQSKAYVKSLTLRWFKEYSMKFLEF